MILLNTIFSSFWIWLGFLILLYTILNALTEIIIYTVAVLKCSSCRIPELVKYMKWKPKDNNDEVDTYEEQEDDQIE